MTAKKNPVTTKTSKKSTLQIMQDKDMTEDRQFAEIGLSTTILNAATASTFTKGIVGDIDLTEAVAVMKEKVNKVNAGDISGLEATLTAQVISLDTIFNGLARRANNSDTLTKLEVYMRLGLKAQAQCARTIEVLANMKNPPIVYAKQANISNGNQQVNNGCVTNGQAPAHTEKIINQPNELLSEISDATMDTSGTTTTSGSDKAMATLET